MCIHIPLPLGLPHTPPSPLCVITEHWAELPVLHSGFPLAIRFTHGSVYMSSLISQFIPHSPSPNMSTLWSCPGTRFLRTAVLDSTHMCQYTIFGFLFLINARALDPSPRDSGFTSLGCSLVSQVILKGSHDWGSLLELNKCRGRGYTDFPSTWFCCELKTGLKTKA